MSKKRYIHYLILSLGLLMSVVLVACGGGGVSSAGCPRVSVLDIAQSVYRFADRSDDPAQLKFQASLGHGAGECSLENGGRQLVVTLPAQVKIVFGPKINKNDTVSVVMTLFDKKSRVINKKIQRIKILDKDDKDIIMGREKYYTWNNRIVTLLDNDHPPESFRVTLAIQLNDDELNRIKGGDSASPLPAGLGF